MAQNIAGEVKGENFKYTDFAKILTSGDSEDKKQLKRI